MEKTDLQRIISVSGKPGLFRIAGNGKSAVVGESLVDGKKYPIHASSKISSLGDISMFTDEEDVPLRDVFSRMKELYSGGPAPDGKAESKLLRSEMDKILPDYTRDRVYDSDLRKLFTWYNILQSKSMLEFVTEEEPQSEEQDSSQATS